VLTTSMKSVGEVMAIGRTFAESLQKALRSLETGLSGLDETAIPGLGLGDDKNAVRAALAVPRPDRLLTVAQALRLGFDVDLIHEASRIDPWFLREIAKIVALEERVKEHGLPKSAKLFGHLKAAGFSDARLGRLSGRSEADTRTLRQALGVAPVFKRVDTCAAEFAAPTAYMYSTYETPFGASVEDEARPSEKTKVIILGGGPNRIGQGIEFDYCCCHAAFALDEDGFESIMVNCNPETVSTDYDTSDRLYFEPLTAEDVLEVVRVEQSRGKLLGVIVQFGGQTPLKLAAALQAANVPILGTSPDMIDLAEDRERFQKLIRKLGLKQPENGTARSVQAARRIVERIGYPIVIRPSYVLGGRGMEIVRDPASLERYMTTAVVVSGNSPVLIDSYLSDAIEVDVDALADGKDVFVCGVMEHIEEAGIHSGDSACSLPPHSLSAATIAEIERQTIALAKALNVGGLMNVQYAVKDGDIYILEVNPRASRTVPFVAKAIGVPIAKIAAKVMAGAALAGFRLTRPRLNQIAVKEAVFPFARFPNVDTLLGPEMRSTGEVMGIDAAFPLAFAKSQIAAGTTLPAAGTVFVSVKDSDKPRIVEAVARLAGLGFRIIATAGTQRFLAAQGIPCDKVNKVLEGRPHIVDAIKNGEVQLVINTTEGAQALADSRSLRRQALLHKVPYFTTLAGASAAALGIEALMGGQLEVRPLQSYFSAA
jgi:carbamoyl-phosphate synthase large subunit